MNGRSGRMVIRTPEGIEFSFQLASPILRGLAWILDIAVIMAISMLLGKILTVVSVLHADTATALRYLLFFALMIGYGMIWEWFWDGRTLGKRVVGIRVMDDRGLRLRFPQVAMRNLLRAVDALPGLYLIGGAVALMTRNYQRLGDIAAGTVVVRTEKHEAVSPGAPIGDRFNSFARAPHFEARLRQRVSPSLTALAQQTILRRDEMDDESRTALFKVIAEDFRALAPPPPELSGELADEQYVRNALDSITRRPRIS